MADIIKILDATALALHSMVHLAINPDEQLTTAGIAEVFEASKHHLAKVHQRLAKAGLIISQRGPTGGVGLAKDPEGITLLEIYEALDGTLSNQDCLFGHPVCDRQYCVFGDLITNVHDQIDNHFTTTTLADLIEKEKA